jgi:hypothetical protein
MKNKERVSEIQAVRKQAEQAWSDNLEAVYEDNQFYLSQQWSAGDIAKAEKKNAPHLSINRIKKIVDLVLGIQMQNRAALGVLPIEGSDSLMAEVIGRTVKWVTKQFGFESKWSECVKDSAIGGLGWGFLDLSYDKDPISGDIILRKVSPFDILPDPDFTELDLSDCGYIIHHKKMDKKKLIALYPEYADEIKECSSATQRTSFFDRFRQVGQDQRDKQVEVIEYWHREWVKKNFTIDGNGNQKEWTGDKETLDAYVADKGISSVSMRVPVIKLAITAGDDVLIYDGESPLGIDDYPHVPLFAYYNSSFDDWAYKSQGVVRCLKDSQRETNKRRSQIMQAVLKMPLSGFAVEENSVDDNTVFKDSGGKGGFLLKYRRGFQPPLPLRPPEIPQSLIQLEQAFQQDMTQIGINPDLLGMMSESGSAGITVQLRQRQGLTALQEVYSNHQEAFRLLGNKVVKIILAQYKKEKIQRILGEDYPIKDAIRQLEQQQDQLKQQIMGEMDRSLSEEGMADDSELLVRNEMFRRQAETQANDIQQRLQILKEEDARFWEEYDTAKWMLRYDCLVDEVTNSPTYRMASLMQLQTVAQSGVQVPPELVIEMLDIPKSTKDKLLGMIQQQQQQIAQQQQMAQQMQMEKIKTEQMKAMAGMSGKMQPGSNGAVSDPSGGVQQ